MLSKERKWLQEDGTLDPELAKGTLIEWLGIQFQQLDPEELIATMPVDHRTHQPAGLLHGGASVALAETVASIGSWLAIDLEKQMAVGLEINANHVRAVTSGFVKARAKPLHLGRSTHLWEVKITDEKDRLVCISRCTVAVLNK